MLKRVREPELPPVPEIKPPVFENLAVGAMHLDRKDFLDTGQCEHLMSMHGFKKRGSMVSHARDGDLRSFILCQGGHGGRIHLLSASKPIKHPHGTPLSVTVCGEPELMTAD